MLTLTPEFMGYPGGVEDFPELNEQLSDDDDTGCHSGEAWGEGKAADELDRRQVADGLDHVWWGSSSDGMPGLRVQDIDFSSQRF